MRRRQDARIMADTVVKNWNELMQALYDIPATTHGRHRSDFVYRGLADAAWGLDTSLYRLGGDYRNIERPMLRSFRKYAEPGSIPSENFWVRLSVAQHHGLPTRVLDWTLSPRVALHFATAEEEHYDKDAVIWCLDVVRARDLLPGDLRAVLEREYAWIFSIEMLEGISSMAAFDDLAKHGPFLLFFEPPSLDARIVNQGAILSVMPGAHLRLSGFLHEHPNIYKRIVISRDIKWEIRDKLDQDNVTERMLFPGLDGLSRWLKRYYGPGSRAARAESALPDRVKP
jgi:FRG domain